MMFFIVNKNDGAETWEYHYSLVIGTLKSNIMLVIVFLFWFLYARKCYSHISFLLNKPEYNSLRIIGTLPRLKQLVLFFVVAIWLLLPVLLYALLIIYIGFLNQYYIQALLVIVFLFILLLGASIGHVRVLNNSGVKAIGGKRFKRTIPVSNFTLIIIQYIFRHHKLTWVGINLFTSVILYVIVRNNTLSERDIKTIFLFYSFGVMCNAILINHARKFEDMYLSFYRTLPVHTAKRFLGYVFFMLILLIPEFITCYILSPGHFQFRDATNFSLSGFGLLLLLNSVSFMRSFDAKEFLKITMVIFCLQYIIIMACGFVVLYSLLLASAVCLFWVNYQKYEPNIDF